MPTATDTIHSPSPQHSGVSSLTPPPADSKHAHSDAPSSRFLSLGEEAPPQCRKTPEPAAIYSHTERHGHPGLVRGTSSNYLSALLDDNITKNLNLRDDNSHIHPHHHSHHRNSSRHHNHDQDNHIPHSPHETEPVNPREEIENASPSNIWRSEFSKHRAQRNSIGYDESKDLSEVNFNVDYTHYPKEHQQTSKTESEEDRPGKSSHSNEDLKDNGLELKSYHSNQYLKDTDEKLLDKDGSTDANAYYKLKLRDQHFQAANNDFLS